MQAVAGICLLVLIRRVETADWSPSAAEAQCRHARIPASLRPLCVRGRTWQQNLRRARIGMIGAAASARSSSRNEHFTRVHIYAQSGILNHAFSTLLAIAVEHFLSF
jgi:hypothetical protein